MSFSRRSCGFTCALACGILIGFGLTGMTRCEGILTGPPDSKFSISTSSFQPGGDIPARFTCSGENLSPALSWTDPPPGTQSLVLIVDDPDAPGGAFNHWVVYNLPSSARQLPEGVTPKSDTNGAQQGHNGFDQVGYGGPCPPPGHPHRYYFRLFALDRKLDLPEGASKNEVERAMKGRVLAQAEVMGKFER